MANGTAPKTAGLRLAPIPRVTVLTRAEWTAINARKWDYVPKAERLAQARARMARNRAERLARAAQGA